ncbi:DapH/DapD/GlmU-related protein [Pontibacillus salicampi]|uniref:DapH/DapD/GlmU-related protein n=1 Tax=Pontibacillus salicampi TaxID=1449801 RepID=A0ABV6LS75_9BACI
MSTKKEERILSSEPYIDETSVVTHSELGEWVSIGSHSLIQESTIMDYTYTDGDANIIYATVGKFCSIASHVRINPSNHPMWRVTQHHMTYRRRQYQFAATDDASIFDWRKEDSVTIGHDVWIGHNAIVMPGVTVGNGAVIGSGAVVTKDVEPYMIVAGVPAKPIKRRFSKDIAQQLEEISWWDWDRSTLEERFDQLNDVERFVERYGKKNG